MLFGRLFGRQFVEELLRRLTDHILATMQILFARFSFEGVALSDDYGTQRGLLVSPGSWRAGSGGTGCWRRRC